MTLALVLATPLAALGLVTAGVLAFVYRFHKEAPHRDVPSLLLWPRPTVLAVSAKHRNRFRFPPSFWLELAILLALTGAALTPLVFLRTDTLLYVVCDVSPSMQAVGPDGTTAAERAARILSAERAARAEGSLVVREVDSVEGIAAELAKASAAEVLVLSDRPPAAELPPGVRWRAVGSPRDNRAITAAVRTSGSLHLTISTFPGGGGSIVSNEVRQLTVPCPWTATNVVVSLQDLGLALADDALAADDAVTLPPPFRPSPTVALAVTNAALAQILHRAVSAADCATIAPLESAEVVLTDQAATDWPAKPHILRFLEASAGAAMRLADPFWIDPDERLLDGVSFGSQSFPAADLTHVAGRPIAFGMAVHPARDGAAAPRALAVRDARTLTLGFARPDLPFFRTPSFPALIVNFLTEAARERAAADLARVPGGVLSAEESDLSRAAAGVWGTARPTTRTRAASHVVGWILALAATAGLIGWGFLHRRWSAYVLAALVLVALIRPYWTLADPGGTLVVLADRSLSLDDTLLREEEFILKSLARTRPAGAKLAVVDFAASARVAPALNFPIFRPSEFPASFRTASDAEAAFLTAAGMMKGDVNTRYLMLSDGLFTVPPSLTAPMPPVDVLALARPFSNDLAIIRVAAPSDVAPEASVPVSVWVRSDTEVTAKWRFGEGTNELARGVRTFRRGLTPIALRDRAPKLGANRRYRFELETPAGDPIPENNVARFLVRTSARKPVLVVRARHESSLAGFLNASGVPAEAVDPSAFDTSLAALSGYAGVILEDQPTAGLGAADFRRLGDWVERLGGGLAMTGGAHTFGPGGWHGSAVEEILPVTLERRQDERKSAISLAIVMDRSGSMSMQATAGGRTKMDMANLGAAGAIDMLLPGDLVSVIAVDETPHLILKMQRVEEARRNMDDVLGIVPDGGGIYVEQGLLAGLRELAKTDTPLKHLVLFADASDSEEPGNYLELLEKAAGAGITVSVIGLGSPMDGDAALLKQIAVAGRGDCYFEDDAREIPRIFLQDTFMATKMLMVTNPTPLMVTSALRPLTDATPPPGTTPVAGGYNLLYARPEASVAVTTADEDAAPFIAYRSVGLGRTAVFAGEVEGPHAAPLMETRFGSELLAALGRYVAGAGAAPLHGFACDIRLVRGGARVTAVPEAPSGTTAWSNDGLRVRVLRDPGGTNEIRRLQWVSEDVLEAFIPMRGGETVVGVVECPDGGCEVLPPVCLMYPAEFLPCEDPKEGERALERIAARTGGRVVSSIAGLWEGLKGRPRRCELAPGLYLLAAALFLLPVARRLRGGMTRGRAVPATADRHASESQKAVRPPADNVATPRISALQRAKRRARV
ncbi:MAG: hypothetical protein ACI4R9_09270 [Kiritimatiellia bacterium]